MTRIDEHINGAKAAFADGAIERGLELLQEVATESNLPAHYFLLKSALIQLSTGDRFSLKDAEEALLRAVEIEPKNVTALTDLGFFYSRVMNRPESAERFFRQALDIMRKDYGDVLGGLLEALCDQPQRADALFESELDQLRAYVSTRMS
jgi:Tfp pilus assembly protein PilF